MSALALISTFLVLHFNVIEDNAVLSGGIAFVIVVVFAVLIRYGEPTRDRNSYIDDY